MTKKSIDGYIKTHGTSYSLANYFFPKQIADKVKTFYAFVRIPDDVVDDPGTNARIAGPILEHMLATFTRLYHQETIEARETDETKSYYNEKEWSELCRLIVRICHEHDIPIEWIEAFFQAMHADLTKKEYQTYDQLKQYMYGSAEVVGLILCKIIGYDQKDEPEVFRTAKLLGEAMQYTNFLRDIQEDYLLLGRLYIPSDRLEQ